MTDPIFIHPQALVESEDIGAGTRIWAFSHVLKGSRIGERCNIGDHSFIESGVIIGNDVTIKNGVSIWDGVEIGNSVFVGPNVAFTNDMHRGAVSITISRSGQKLANTPQLAQMQRFFPARISENMP